MYAKQDTRSHAMTVQDYLILHIQSGTAVLQQATCAALPSTSLQQHSCSRQHVQPCPDPFYHSKSSYYANLFSGKVPTMPTGRPSCGMTTVMSVWRGKEGRLVLHAYRVAAPVGQLQLLHPYFTFLFSPVYLRLLHMSCMPVALAVPLCKAEERCHHAALGVLPLSGVLAGHDCPALHAKFACHA